MKKTLATIALGFAFAGAHAGQCPAYLEGEYRKLHSSESLQLCSLLNGRDALVVNTASHCGYTPQFKALEALHQQYKDEGLTVVGFASDDFNQAAKSEKEAATICYTNYGVTFTMLSPTGVRGDQANRLFRYLGERTEQPGWNFNKYLLDGQTGEVRHFESGVEPDSEAFTRAVESLLAE